jgi:quinol monooxygenase YgiN
LDAHLQQPYIRAFLGESDELLAEPVDISFWQMISSPKQPAR